MLQVEPKSVVDRFFDKLFEYTYNTPQFKYSKNYKPHQGKKECARRLKQNLPYTQFHKDSLKYKLGLENAYQSKRAIEKLLRHVKNYGIGTERLKAMQTTHKTLYNGK